MFILTFCGEEVQVLELRSKMLETIAKIGKLIGNIALSTLCGVKKSNRPEIHLKKNKKLVVFVIHKYLVLQFFF